jgi:RimJ/RimL family protein N-acetyltransferase
MVEVGYEIDPALRRKDYARATLVGLLRRAGAGPMIRMIRAKVSPDNVASLALITQFPFARVGEQSDEKDGIETAFEIDAPELLSGRLS